MVYGEFKAGKNGNTNRTLLFYNHYDVQPEDPLDEWKTDPFDPVVKSGKLYCRGVADNKANFMARMNAIQFLQETYGGLPCNIKFLIEGEEEIGSPHIDAYLKQYAELFKADACIWEFGSKDAQERMELACGVKGIAYFDLAVQTAEVDSHSSNAAVIDNAAWRLTQALASMRNAQHEILIDGFYDLMDEPTDLEYNILNQMPFDQEALRESFGVKGEFITKNLPYGEKEAMIFYPTLTISGMISGYTGSGAKTVLPSQARAKLDVRLVPGYTPEAVEHLLRHHLDNYGFEDVEVTQIASVMPFRTQLDHPFINIVAQAARETYGDQKVVIIPNSSGTGPMYSFAKHLAVPIVGSGTEYYNSSAHAPNEHIRLDDFYQGTVHMIKLLERFGEANDDTL